MTVAVKQVSCNSVEAALDAVRDFEPASILILLEDESGMVMLNAGRRRPLTTAHRSWMLRGGLEATPDPPRQEELPRSFFERRMWGE